MGLQNSKKQLKKERNLQKICTKNKKRSMCEEKNSIGAKVKKRLNVVNKNIIKVKKQLDQMKIQGTTIKAKLKVTKL